MPISISDPQAQERAANVKRICREVGFDTVGLAVPEGISGTAERLHAWLAQGCHGDMAWMADTAERRGHPRALWPETRSIVMLGLNYGPDEDPLALLEQRAKAAISVYARNRDYHDLIKKRLKAAARQIVAEYGAQVKVFVDTAPVMEKPIAAAAGLGWQGKHTNLVSREKGSWLFLGAIFTTMELPPDEPHEDRCGNCHACLDICPTQAFVGPYRLDARACISYLTIENKEPIPFRFRRAMGNRIYGCDDCLAVCPWNKFAERTHEQAFHARENLRAPLLAELVELDEQAFRAYFTASPIKRIGHARFLRNVLIAIGNSGEQGMAETVRGRLSDSEPLIRGAAIWALGALGFEEEVRRLAEDALRQEECEDVRAEWDYWLSSSASK